MSLSNTEDSQNRPKSTLKIDMSSTATDNPSRTKAMEVVPSKGSPGKLRLWSNSIAQNQRRVENLSLFEMAKRTHNLAFKGYEPHANRTLFIFSTNCLIRRLAMAIANNRWFEYVIILTIVVNCICLAIERYLPENDKFEILITMEKSEIYFLAIYIAELIFKVLAMGFLFERDAFMLSLWNLLDFIVVATGIYSIIETSSNVNLRILRGLRVLRPIKLISGTPSLQVVLKSILKAIAPLSQIGLLVLFLILIFAIIGLEFYSGAFHMTCFKLDNPYELPTSVPRLTDSKICAPAKNAAPGSQLCPPGYVCKYFFSGPNYGITNFDNILYAMLTVFQCITSEGWTDVYYWTNESIGSRFNWIYFIPLIVLGSFFMLNLVLGVISGEFAKERERVEKRSEFVKLHRQQQQETIAQGYLDWIDVGEEVMIMNQETANRAANKSKSKKRRKNRNKNDDNPMKEYLRDLDAAMTSTEAGEEPQRKGRARQLMKIYRMKLKLLLKSQTFYWLIIIIVLLNTITMSVDYYNKPDWLEVFSFFAEYFFLGIFLFEILLKMFVLGFTQYFESKFNMFDLIVVILSFFEIIYQNIEPETSFGFSALRSIRLLRIFKLTPYWLSLRNLIVSLLSSLRSILSLLFLLFIFIFISALLGMQLFGGEFNFSDGKPMQNFDSIFNAIITVFQMLTGEDWNVIMYSGIHSQKNAPMAYSIYFIVIVLLGNYVLLNVFLAIAVDNLANAQELTAAEENAMAKENEKDMENDELDNLLDISRKPPPLKICPPSPVICQYPSQIKQITINEEISQTVGPILGDINEEDPSFCQRMKYLILRPKPQEKIVPVYFYYSSVFVFRKFNIIRRIAHFIVHLESFELFIIFVILASSLALATEDIIEPKVLRNRFLNYFDYVFTGVFTVELLLKIINMGAFLHPQSYCRDLWNILDIIVVICALISYFYSSDNSLGIIKTLRVLRVLRPIKTIRRVPKLKVVFDCVVSSIKNVFNIFVVFLLFKLIFALVGTQLFKGKFFYCTDPSKMTVYECQGQFIKFDPDLAHPTTAKRRWKRFCFSFDNVLFALVTLFASSTGEGWPDVLKNSINTVAVNRGPETEYSKQMTIFYIVFIIVFPFFFINIFVALIIITFQEEGKDEVENTNLDRNQKSCLDFVIHSRPYNNFMPDKRTLPFRYRIWRFIMSTPFEYFILILICMNTLTLMSKAFTVERYLSTVLKEGDYQENFGHLVFCDVIFYLNIVFTIIFTIEAILKNIAFTPRNYFTDFWNIFDFITVIGSILDVIITLADDSDNKVNIGSLKLFRAARLIKLLRQNDSIRILLWTFLQSFKSLPYVCALIGLMLFIYAVIGMQMFGSIQLSNDSSINIHNNFQTFFSSLMLLFRCATGESWQQIMVDVDAGKNCAVKPPRPPKDCGTDFSYFYFISFIFICSFIFLNLFVAVIMDNFEYLTRDPSILGPHHLESFIRVWAQFDSGATGKVHLTQVYEILRKIEPPVGFGTNCPFIFAHMKLIRMNVPVDADGNVNFTTTFMALIREALGICMDENETMAINNEKLRQIIRKLWPKQARSNKMNLIVPSKQSYDKHHLTIGKFYTGLYILECWRKYKIEMVQQMMKLDGSKSRTRFRVQADDIAKIENVSISFKRGTKNNKKSLSIVEEDDEEDKRQTHDAQTKSFPGVDTETSKPNDSKFESELKDSAKTARIQKEDILSDMFERLNQLILKKKMQASSASNP